jgi:hypothetical protein
MAITLEEMRHILFQTLRIPGFKNAPRTKVKRKEHDASHVVMHMERVAEQQGIGFARAGDELSGFRLADEDDHTYRVVLNELATAGLIVLGTSLKNSALPWFQITDYGRHCLEQGEVTPYDPDGYLKYLRDEATKAADDTVLRYVTESMQCLRFKCFMASAVMLGGATEQVFLLVAKALHAAIRDPKRQQRFGKKVLKELRLKAKYDAFLKEMAKQRAGLPRDLKEDLDIHLNGIFALIRKTRNEAGHPSGKEPSAREAHGNLLLFPTYCREAHGLIEFFENNQV